MSAAPPGTREGGLAFEDARGCKEWLASLPLTNIPQAQSLLLEAIKALNQAEPGGIERLKCLELLRDKVAFLQREQRSRYFGKSLPLSANDNSAWMTGRALLEEMEAGYRKVAEASASDAELGRHAALVAQRIVRYIGAQMLFHALVYRRFDLVLWPRLHREYRQAEASALHAERVKDSLDVAEAQSSVADTYAQVLLMQGAYLSELAAPEMDFTEGLLRMWITKVTVGREPAADSTHALAVDLEGDIGPRPLAQVDAGAARRVIDTSAISKSIRKRMQALKNEADPATVGLPAEAAHVDVPHMLQRLHRLWCEGMPPRPPARVPAEKSVSVVFGLGDIHFFVTGGKVFEQPDMKRELTAREKQDIEVFGRITERTQTSMMAAHSYNAEAWGVVDEMRGAWRLLRPATASKGVSIGKLVAMRVTDTTPFFLGMVSALVQETDGRIIATVTLFPGKPEPLAVRAADARNRANAKWLEGFRLPEMPTLRVASTLVVPSGLAQRGRGIELWLGQPQESTVYEVVERGTDFDRITVF